MMITAKFQSQCAACPAPIRVGEAILWERGKPARHVFCPTPKANPFAEAPNTDRAASAAYQAALAGQPVQAPKTLTATLPNASVILGLFQAAGSKLRWPKITLDQDGQTLRLQVAGPNSKYAGDIMITDGLPFGQNTWYGRITRAGEFVGSRNATPWVLQTLSAFASDPAGYAARYGHKTGNCCFCGQGLTTTESTEVGYGPVCADHYNLPWGHKHAHAA